MDVATNPSLAPIARRLPRKRYRNRRLDGRTRMARRIRVLSAEYTARLGPAAANPLVAADIQQLSEHTALSEASRGALLRGEKVNLEVLNRVESRAYRMKVALGLAGTPPAPPLDAPVSRAARKRLAEVFA